MNVQNQADVRDNLKLIKVIVKADDTSLAGDIPDEAGYDEVLRNWEPKELLLKENKYIMKHVSTTRV